MPPGSLLRLSVSNEPLCRKSGSQVTWSPPPWVVINWWSRWSRRRNDEDLSLVCHQQPGHNCTRGRRKRSFLILTSPRKLSPVTNTNIILKISFKTCETLETLRRIKQPKISINLVSVRARGQSGWKGEKKEQHLLWNWGGQGL